MQDVCSVYRIDFGEEPGATGIGRKQLHDGPEVDFIVRVADRLLLAAILRQLGFDFGGEKFHCRLLSWVHLCGDRTAARTSGPVTRRPQAEGETGNTGAQSLREWGGPPVDPACARG